ncbi:hypothetical protein AMECASPLE_011797 [Ameca splendens]|uniref:Secreted protein n=1 Tax=Ameca splendens TaxID=208324 RepID=A0ABV0Y0X1_9TELE
MSLLACGMLVCKTRRVLLLLTHVTPQEGSAGSSVFIFSTVYQVSAFVRFYQGEQSRIRSVECSRTAECYCSPSVTQHFKISPHTVQHTVLVNYLPPYRFALSLLFFHTP